jgi:hypothetical protein
VENSIRSKRRRPSHRHASIHDMDIRRYCRCSSAFLLFPFALLPSSLSNTVQTDKHTIHISDSKMLYIPLSLDCYPSTSSVHFLHRSPSPSVTGYDMCIDLLSLLRRTKLPCQTLHVDSVARFRNNDRVLIWQNSLDNDDQIILR